MSVVGGQLPPLHPQLPGGGLGRHGARRRQEHEGPHQGEDCVRPPLRREH